MKKLFLILTLVFSLSAYTQTIEQIIKQPPAIPKLVNDFSGTLTPEQVQALESKLVAYNDSTSTQIAVVLVKDLGSYSVEDAAIEILRNWGVGGKANNNGVVILVSIAEKKIRIETGYGMEGVLPDVTAKTIIDNEMTPNFREGNYYRGIDRAIDAIFLAAAGQYKGTGSSPKGKGGFPAFGLIILIIIMLSIFGGGGRRGGGMASRRGYRDFGTGWILGSILSNLGRSGGGGWSGGGGGWSGGGGGGFGGFGGGGGGGGGASGSW